jgi:uncharacterized protein YrzB (UPF0473 family)
LPTARNKILEETMSAARMNFTEEQMEALQRFIERYTPTVRRDGPDPAHRGVIDPNYVRPAPTEFPKMLHHATGMTKIVASHHEEKALMDEGGWALAPQKRKADWKSKLNEVYTVSGFQVFHEHLDFLLMNDVPNVKTLQDAAKFINMLDAEQQEQFFREAASFEPKEAVKKK